MNIEKRLKNIQDMLEDYFTDYKGAKEYIVVCRKVENLYAREEDGVISCVSLIFTDDDNKRVNYNTRNIEDFEALTNEDIINQLIHKIYEEDINCRNRIIKNWKAYSLQKVKSLALHMSKGNSDKVQSINNDLIERYKLVERCKKDVEYFKKFVRSLYFIKNNLIEGDRE